MMDYSAGRLTASIVGAVGWLCVGVAIVMAASGLTMGNLWAAIIVAAPVAFAGLLIVMLAQLVKAQFSAAEGIWRLVEMTKFAGVQAERASGSTNALSVTSASAGKSDGSRHQKTFVEVYRGVSVYRIEGGFHALNCDYADMMSVRTAIDGHLARR